MSKQTKCPFSPGDIVKDQRGIRFEVIALVASGKTLVWLWPEGKTLEGTNRIKGKVSELELIKKQSK